MADNTKGVLSKGITLSYKGASDTSYTQLTNLQEIPNIGGTAESVEVTTLDDAAHMFINGILSYGESLDFTFLYEKEQFATLAAMGGANAATYSWQVGLPDGTSGAVDTTATFDAKCSVAIAGVGVNAPITYTLSLKPQSEITFA